MTEHSNRWVSMRLQFIALLLFSVVLGVFIAIGVRLLGVRMVKTFYFTPEYTEARSEALLDSFSAYVQEHHLCTEDAEEVAEWVQGNRYCFLTVSSADEELLSMGWVGNEAYYSAIQRAISAQQGSGQDGTASRMVAFEDGSYRVFALDFSERPLMQLVRVVGILIGVLIPVLILTGYSSYVIRRILKLEREVDKVLQGNLQSPITCAGEDEIGDLSRNVSAMRDTVMEKMRAEQRAWEANSELITRMSHDTRTPLTVLVGYLELLEEGQFSDDESYRHYLNTCKGNAFQLKELADELFQYFLVFGHRSYEIKPEPMKAKTLLSQLIGEHIMLLREKGWQFRLDPVTGQEALSARMLVDPVYLKRLFDNLFSNIEKYADPDRPVSVSSRLEQNQIHVCMKNDIRPEPNPAESTEIGLKTCERIAELMGGTFRVRRDQTSFQTDLYLPVWKDN